MIRKLIVVAGNIGLVFAIGVFIAVMGSMAPKPESQVSEPRLVAAFVEEVAFEPISLTVTAQGEVRPKREIALTPQVGGQITFVADNFIDGGIIKEGDLLVRLEDADYKLAVTRAKARVANSLQALQVEQAEAELARADFEELSGSTGAAPSELTLRKPQLARAEAEYESARADLAEAELALRRAEIRAPFDGRVRSISANFGQFVSPGAQIGQLFSTDIAEVRLPLSDGDLAKLQLPMAFSATDSKGPKVTFTTSAAGQGRTWEGHLVRVAAAIDPTTRQISAIAQVDDPYGAGSDNGFPMAVGLFVSAKIEGPELDRAVVVPRVAVSEDNFVAVLNDDDEVVKRQVTVAATTETGVIVTDGIEQGERLVVSRLGVPSGTKVRPLDPSNPDAANETAPESTSTAASEGAAQGGMQ